MLSLDSASSWETDPVQLTKHHGLGNDFLVVLDEVNGHAPRVDAELARRLCNRRTGIGADGLIHGAAPDEAAHPGVDVVMHLFNSDGSRAEMSGNGIRCLAQAVALARRFDAGSLSVSTDAGARTLELRTVSPVRVEVDVDMGAVHPGPAVPAPVDEELDDRHVTLDLGNPHLVIESTDPDAVDLATRGAWLEQQFPDGVNVEFISKDPGRADAIVLRVWERGAGITRACGTGACAAAHAAHLWGLVGDIVTVEMPGGEAQVRLDEHAILVGPAVLIATMEVPDA
jgi:diaminopimelate epimerase